MADVWELTIVATLLLLEHCRALQLGISLGLLGWVQPLNIVLHPWSLFPKYIIKGKFKDIDKHNK